MSHRLYIDFMDSNNQIIQKVDYFTLSGKPCYTELELRKSMEEVLSFLNERVISTEVSIQSRLEDPLLAIHTLQNQISRGTQLIRKELSVREHEIVNCLLQGLSTLDISERLFISCETVRTHRRNILKKTGLSSTVALLNYYNQVMSVV